MNGCGVVCVCFMNVESRCGNRQLWADSRPGAVHRGTCNSMFFGGSRSRNDVTGLTVEATRVTGTLAETG